MEKIIIWVVIAIGAVVYEQIKKYIFKKADCERDKIRQSGMHPGGFDTSASRSVTLPPPPPMEFEDTEEFEEFEEPEPGRRMETPLARAARLRGLPEEGECALREHHLHQETDQEQPSEPIQTISEAEEASRAAHFDRWRRAVIDTQILERKF